MMAVSNPVTLFYTADGRELRPAGGLVGIFTQSGATRGPEVSTAVAPRLIWCVQAADGTV